MVDPDNIVKLFAFGNPADPPVIAGLFVQRPVIQRIAPYLSCSRKTVRRHARDHADPSSLIQLEQVSVGPEIGTVRGNINGDIPDDRDTL